MCEGREGFRVGYSLTRNDFRELKPYLCVSPEEAAENSQAADVDARPRFEGRDTGYQSFFAFLGELSVFAEVSVLPSFFSSFFPPESPFDPEDGEEDDLA
jgi:hypothetical protein